MHGAHHPRIVIRTRCVEVGCGDAVGDALSFVRAPNVVAAEGGIDCQALAELTHVF
ncbi:hypothetical protein D3C83_156250 [compost metagenome]